MFFFIRFSRWSLVQQKRKLRHGVDVRGSLSDAVGSVWHLRNDNADRGIENIVKLANCSRRMFAKCDCSIVRSTVHFLRNSLTRPSTRVLRSTATDDSIKHSGSEHRRQRGHCTYRQLTGCPGHSDVSSVTGIVASVRNATAASECQTAVGHHPTNSAESCSCSATAYSWGNKRKFRKFVCVTVN